MKILLVGEESAGVRVFRMLAGGPHRLVAVLTSKPKVAVESTSLWCVAENEGHRVWPAKMAKDPDFPEKIRAEQVDILLNIHSLYVLPRAVIEAPRYGCFNLHPGPLPRYAGLNAVSWAIYRGERNYGVTLHKMAADIDTGPIAYQTLFEIGDDESALSVFTRCIKEGLSLVSKLLETAALNPEAIPLIPQDISQREYFGRGVPNNGWIRWSRPAREIVSFVRACDYAPFRSPWGHPRTSRDGQEISILEAARTGRRCDSPPGTVGQLAGSEVLVAAADEWVLLRRVLVAGKALSPASVLPLGAFLQDAATSPKT